MLKTMFLFALCLPLGWMAWRESRYFYETPPPPPPPTGQPPGDGPGANPLPKPEELAKIKKDADAIVNLPKGVVAAVIRLDDPPDGLIVPASASGQSLEDLLIRHAKERAGERKKVEKARVDLAKFERDINILLERIRGDDGRPRYFKADLDKLKDALKGYKSLPVTDPEFLDSAQAEADWPDLDKDFPPSFVDLVYDDIDHWTPATTDSSLIQDAETAKKTIDAYRVYRDKFLSVKGAVAVGLLREAKDRLEFAERGAEMIAQLRKAPDRRIEQVKAIVLLVEGNPPDRIAATAKRLLQALCGDFIKIEPLDKMVYLISSQHRKPELLSREQIRICWKNSTTCTLKDSGFDEYNLPRQRVDYFLLSGETRNLPSDEAIAPLRGTDYSNAIREYNTARAGVRRWTEAELVRLGEICKPNEEVLTRPESPPSGRSLIGRIESLLAVVRRNPSLFNEANP